MRAEVWFGGHRIVGKEAGGEEGDGGVVVGEEGKEVPKGRGGGVAVFWVSFTGVVFCCSVRLLR